MEPSNFNIAVQFIDDVTGDAFACSEMPADSLPESFELNTTLHIGDDDWDVVDAQPKTRSEYAKSKTLTLRLRRIEKIDPSKILFSLATICDRLPPTSGAPVKRSDNDIMLHEDDWCQIEFVASDDLGHIAAQVAQIRRFKMDNWTGSGWKDIFVRPDHPTNLASLKIGFDAVQKVFSDASPGRVLIYQSFFDPEESACEVSGGFSFRICNGVVVYGHQVEGIVASLGAEVFVDEESVIESISKPFLSIGQLGRLLLVDWNTDQTVRINDQQEVERWLTLLADPG